MIKLALSHNYIEFYLRGGVGEVKQHEENVVSDRIGYNSAHYSLAICLWANFITLLSLRIPIFKLSIISAV